MHIEPSQPEQGRSNFKDNTGEVSSMLLTPRVTAPNASTPGLQAELKRQAARRTPSSPKQQAARPAFRAGRMKSNGKSIKHWLYCNHLFPNL